MQNCVLERKREIIKRKKTSHQPENKFKFSIHVCMCVCTIQECSDIFTIFRVSLMDSDELAH